MDLHELRDHIDQRFDRLEDKVDGHSDRISRSEVSIEFISGNIKMWGAIFLAVISSAFGWLFSKLP